MHMVLLRNRFHTIPVRGGFLFSSNTVWQYIRIVCYIITTWYSTLWIYHNVFNYSLVETDENLRLVPVFHSCVQRYPLSLCKASFRVVS